MQFRAIPQVFDKIWKAFHEINRPHDSNCMDELSQLIPRSSVSEISTYNRNKANNAVYGHTFYLSLK